MLGVGFVVTLGLSGVATGGAAIKVHLPLILRLGVGLVTIALDIVGFCLAYSFLTKRDLTFRQVLPGAVFAGVLFFLLQLGGTALVTHGAQGHTGATGSMATVLGMLWWFSLQGQAVLYGAEINVVKVEQLWPRGLVDAPDTEADERAYSAYAEEKTFRPNQTVTSSFRDGSTDGGRATESGRPPALTAFVRRAARACLRRQGFLSTRKGTEGMAARADQGGGARADQCGGGQRRPASVQPARAADGR